MPGQRRKCFTGCWTCRSRRVKCDEATPLCKRCRQFGVQCEGYGVRLSWVHSHSTPSLEEVAHGNDAVEDGRDNDGEIRNSRLSRRSLTYLGVSDVPRLSSPELDDTLIQIDEWCPGEPLQPVQGGFSVFPADFVRRRTVSEQPRASSPVPSNNDRESVPTETIEETNNAFSETSEPTPLHITSDTHYLDVVPATTNHGIRWEDAFGRQSEPTVADKSQASLQQQYASFPPRHVDALPMPSNQKRLIHHWVTFTSRKVALIDEPHNPCRTMMLPMALKGLMSSSEASNADVATFHALCAAAAFNLYELGNRTHEQDRVLALRHDQQAIRHLRDNLGRADEHRDESFAMAIVACIAVDAISGTTQRWRTHVSGGLAYLDKLRSRGMDDVLLSAFQQHMVSMAILCDFPVSSDLKSFLNNSSPTKGCGFTFPYYGISTSFLRAHDRMNTFAAAAATASKTPTSEKELDAFELQLYLDFPTLSASDLTSQTETQGAVLSHMSKAFYYAGVVFFQRSIRRVPIQAVQALVEQGVSELESVERVGKGERGCMMLWPVLVLGSECGTLHVQRRMRKWFRDQRKLGFRNLVVLEELVGAVWGAREDPAAKGDNIDWRNIINVPRFDIFRL